MQTLKIVIFEGSFTTTPFINRLIRGLSHTHNISIIGFKNSITTKVSNVDYVDLGSSQKIINLVWPSILLSFKLFFKKGKFGQFFSTFKNIVRLNKKQLQQDNFNKAMLLIAPDILHVQWPSLLSWCEEVSKNRKIKIVLSQRGYQTNVRPFVNEDNFEFLKDWYPKISGFHSVSKAISLIGDTIYTSSTKIDKVVYSGFDFEELLFSENYKITNPLRLISIGRPHWIKGYADALQTCKLLKGKRIEFNYTIVGAEGNEELQYIIQDLGLTENITLSSKISQQEVYKHMEKSGILLFPSIMEGLPNVVVEAMAVGLPVLSTKCGGVEELLDEKTGWLVPTRDPEAMAEALINFTETSVETIDKIRKNARNKVEEQHSVAKMVERMEELYLEVINE